MDWHFNNEKPIYIQITEKIKTDIVCGVYEPNAKIPGVRELAFEASVNPNTMQRAMRDLEAEGLLVTQGTNGRFVTEDQQLISQARQTLIKEYADEFIKKCKKFGLSDSEISKLILKGEI